MEKQRANQICSCQNQRGGPAGGGEMGGWQLDQHRPFTVLTVNS